MKPNKHGCKPDEDVCLIHIEPLICDHGCEHAKPHRCEHAIPCSECGKMLNVEDLLTHEWIKNPDRKAVSINSETVLCDECRGEK